MILHFKTPETGVVCGDVFLSLTGETFGGEIVEGRDSTRTVGCKCLKRAHTKSKWMRDVETKTYPLGERKSPAV